MTGAVVQIFCRAKLCLKNGTIACGMQRSTHILKLSDRDTTVAVQINAFKGFTHTTILFAFHEEKWHETEYASERDAEHRRQR